MNHCNINKQPFINSGYFNPHQFTFTNRKPDKANCTVIKIFPYKPCNPVLSYSGGKKMAFKKDRANAGIRLYKKYANLILEITPYRDLGKDMDTSKRPNQPLKISIEDIERHDDDQ